MSKERIRIRIIEKQKNKCCYCRREMSIIPNKASIKQVMGVPSTNSARAWQLNPLRPTLEHVIPISNNGKNSSSNYLVSCQCCNTSKASMPHEVFSTLVYDESSIILFTIERNANKKINKLRKHINRKFNRLKSSIDESI